MPSDKNEITKLFEERGMHWTVQRQLILQNIEQRHGHFNVEDIHSEISHTFPSIHRSTVYRTLETLCEIGLLTPVNDLDELKRYELIQDKPHYPAHCDKCDKEVEIQESLIRKVQAQVWQDYGLKLHFEHFVGLIHCDDCSE